MSDSAARDRAIPTATDIAVAKAVKARRTSGEPELPPVDGESPADVAVKGEPSEMSALRAELAELRKLVMSQNKAPTSARRIGEVADAEMAAQAVDGELAELLEEAGPRGTVGKDGETVFAAEDREKMHELRKKIRKATEDVDIARALAGLIPRTHPGLKRLPPEHPVFRVR